MRRWLIPAALGALLLVGSAAKADTGVPVPDAAEAWYQTSASTLCTSPVGCGALGSPNPYPAGTLHVGVAAGQETARTYLRPDLSAIPAGATLEGARTTVPLDLSGPDGSASPGSATIEACLVSAPFDNGVQGSLSTPPAVDCSVNTAAMVTATDLTVDLASFVRAWDLGRPNRGFALIPVAAPGATWHVVFDARSRTGAHPASTVVTYSTDEGAVVPTTAAPFVPVTSAPQVLLPAPATTLPPAAVTFPTTPPASTAPNVPQPVPAAAVPVTVVAYQGFRYSAAMLLPLVFIVAVGWVCRLLLRDAAPYRRKSA